MLTFSATESFLEPDALDMWPKEITNNVQFEKQTNERNELISSLENVIQALPSPTTKIEDAVAEGQLEESKVVALYDSLTDLIKQNEYQRSLLYIPFEFLPSTAWQPEGELRQSVERFREAYLEAWYNLLGSHDVRANFVDGNVMEVEQRTGDLPRVVKAAHLIPKLVEAGLLTMPHVIQYMEETDDELLLESMVATIPILQDLGLITEGQYAQIAARVSIPTAEISEPKSQPITLDSIGRELARIQSEVSPAFQGIETQKRKQWLSETMREQTASRVAESLIPTLIAQDSSRIELARFLVSSPSDEHLAVVIEGIGRAVEEVAGTQSEAAKILFQNFLDILEMAPPETHRVRTKVLRRLYSIGILSGEMLARFSIPVPNLIGPIRENVQSAEAELNTAGQKTIEVVATIEGLYPAALIYGSRVKGYGEADSDIDIAVFVRPGTPESVGENLSESLPDATEFWLDEKEGRLQIHNFSTSNQGHSSWAHILFGGIWAGQTSAVKELYSKLLTGYLYQTEEELYGRPVREVWLEEMERDALQYRLMHKGYERFTPRKGGLDTPSAELVDGKSAFWDSGYRRLSLQLYAKKVFLPKIAKD